VEADDDDTRRVLARLELGPPFSIITAPPFGPRTKPKALNVALPFAQGSFTVVYDAEDVPEPDQLRRALDTFMTADGRLACVQASLTIDNATDSWLARMFTAGYAGQFDAFLPGLAALHLPLPLGGSSNHFRTAALRQVGGWDSYNVTEDADLGIRLCRFGYHSTAMSSATYEEAPAHFGPWLRQRTRWYKGWMRLCQAVTYLFNFKCLLAFWSLSLTRIATLSQQRGKGAGIERIPNVKFCRRCALDDRQLGRQLSGLPSSRLAWQPKIFIFIVVSYSFCPSAIMLSSSLSGATNSCSRVS
jgi:cellulose synthase/poly-beta-1,6-N-acetylglucosamine synthase-like glycosyltransferase